MNRWKTVWEGKAGDSIAAASGRSKYTNENVDTLVAQALSALRPGIAEGSLLDIGCAAGLMGAQLKEYVSRYVGVDFSMDAVSRFAFERNVQAYCASATDLPFKNAEFTHSLMSSVLLCLTMDECRTALREMRRVTTKVGFISGNLRGEQPPGGENCSETCSCYAHCTWFWPSQLADMCIEAGWRNPTELAIDPSLSHSAYMFDMRVEA